MNPNTAKEVEAAQRLFRQTEERRREHEQMLKEMQEREAVQRLFADSAAREQERKQMLMEERRRSRSGFRFE